MFFRGSRYEKVGEEEIADGGRVIRYKRIRFIPQTRALGGHLVGAGERLDHIAYRYFRDPERFWRICDANHVLWPDDLIAQPGRTILIPASEE
jgi:hypothetical protein